MTRRFVAGQFLLQDVCVKCEFLVYMRKLDAETDKKINRNRNKRTEAVKPKAMPITRTYNTIVKMSGEQTSS